MDYHDAGRASGLAGQGRARRRRPTSAPARPPTAWGPSPTASATGTGSRSRTCRPRRNGSSSSGTAAATSSGPSIAPNATSYKYDGYIAIDGNKKQIDGEDVPFILQTGLVREDAPACMVLFTPKGTPLTPRGDVAGHPRPAGGRRPAAGQDDGTGALSGTRSRCSSSTGSSSRTISATGSRSRRRSRAASSSSGPGEPRPGRPSTASSRSGRRRSCRSRAGSALTLPCRRSGADLPLRRRARRRGHGQDQPHPRRAALERRPEEDAGHSGHAAGRLRPSAPLRPGAGGRLSPSPSTISRTGPAIRCPVKVYGAGRRRDAGL